MSSLELDNLMNNSSLMWVNSIHVMLSVASMILESLFHFDFCRFKKMKIEWILASFVCTETRYHEFKFVRRILHFSLYLSSQSVFLFTIVYEIFNHFLFIQVNLFAIFIRNMKQNQHLKSSSLYSQLFIFLLLDIVI